MAHLVGIVGVDGPAFEWSDDDGSGGVHSVAAARGARAALEVGNHGKFRIVSVGVDVAYGGAEACQGVIEAVGKSAVAEGCVAVHVVNLDVGAEFQPVRKLRLQTGVEVVALHVDVGKAQDALFAVVSAADEVLCLLRSAGKAEVMLLFEGEVLVVEVEVVGVSDSALGVFESGVHRGIRRKFLPGVDARGVVAVLAQEFEFFVAVESGASGVRTSVVPVLCEGVAVDHVGKDGGCGPCRIALVADAHLAAFAAFGGDEYDTVGGAGTVDGARSGILEHRNVENVIGVHFRQAHLHTVDQHIGS